MNRQASFLGVLASLVGTSVIADPRMPGGETTVFDDSREAFAQPASNLDPKSLAQFFSGDTIFNTNWVNSSSVVDGRDGLGPLFNTRSCSACHFKDGRGQPPESGETPNGLLIRISIPGKQTNGAPLPHPIYGNQISVRSLDPAPPEAFIRVDYEEIEKTYPDGTSYRIQKPKYTIESWAYGEIGSELLTSPRVAPSVFGLGLLDEIPNKSILANADPSDENQDGISGRPNWVWSPSETKRQLGKYGWKANKASIADQTAGAFQGDIGITSSLFPSENHSSAQIDSNRFPSGGSPELVERDLEDVVFYLKTLGVPASRFEDESVYHIGGKLFAQAQCSKCHTPEFQTRSDSNIAALANQLIRPFTDLLLHDMGDELADNRPDFEASGNEWRTPPLWGLGLISRVNGHTRLLHDGRARNIEEAILWHGGEAEASKQAFMRLPKSERQALIEFVNSL